MITVVSTTTNLSTIAATTWLLQQNVWFKLQCDGAEGYTIDCDHNTSIKLREFLTNFED